MADEPDQGPSTPTHREPPDSDLGGDPACWLRHVCPACGRFVETELPAACPRCGAELPDD